MKNLTSRLNNALFEIISKNDKNISAVRKLNRNIINSSGLNIANLVEESEIDFENRTQIFLVIAAIQNIINDVKIGDVIPVAMFLGMYSIKVPELFVKKTHHILTATQLNKRERIAKALLTRWYDNIPNVEKKRIATELKRLTIRNMSEIYKDVSFTKMTKDEMIEKYNSKSRVERALRTEQHEQFEMTKKEYAKAFGATHKTWVTQRDARVRDTAWHNGVSNRRVPINNDFYAAGMNASYPGDVRLPIGERINCRCYLIYDNAKV